MKYLNLKLNLNQLTGLYLKMGFELRGKAKHNTYIHAIKIKTYEQERN